MSESRPPTPESMEVKRRGRHRLIGAITLAVLAVVAIPMLLDSEPRKVSKELALNIPARDALPALAPPDDKAPVKPVEPASVPGTQAAAVAAPAQDAARLPQAAVPAGNATATATATPAETARPEVTDAKAADKASSRPAPRAPEKSPDKARGSAAEKAADKGAEKVSDKSGARVAAKTSEKPAASQEGFVIQLGAFSDAEKLAALKSRMKAARISVFTEDVQTSTGKLTRLRAGPYKTREQAEKALASIKKAGGEGKVVPLS